MLALQRQHIGTDIKNVWSDSPLNTVLEMFSIDIGVIVRLHHVIVALLIGVLAHKMGLEDEIEPIINCPAGHRVATKLPFGL